MAIRKKTDYYSASGTWTCPAGVTSALVELWGAGGGGHNGVGAGGGGAYAAKTVTVVPGNTYSFTVAAATAVRVSGGDSSWDGGVVLAKGGQSATAGGLGGQAASCVGDIAYSGGNGQLGTSFRAGSGGAGSRGAGSGGSGTTAGSGGDPDGGNGGLNNSAATVISPGGSGGANDSVQAGGQRGACRVTYDITIDDGYPSLVTWYNGRGGDNVTSHPITFPSLSAGQMLFLIFSTKSSALPNTPSDWTYLDTSVSGADRQTIFYKTTSGSESLTVTTASGCRGIYTILVTENVSNIIYTISSSSGSAANPPSIDVGTSRKFLNVVTATMDTSGSPRWDAAPSTYDTLQYVTQASALWPTHAFAVKEIDAQTEDPGAFNVTAEEWSSFSLALLGEIPTSVDTDVFTVSFESSRNRTFATDILYYVQPTDAITKTLTYALTSDITSQLDSQYAVETNSTEQLQSIYKIRPTSTLQYAIDYAVEYGTALTKAVAYRIIDAVQLSKQLLYKLTDDSATQQNITYKVIVDNTETTQIRYEVEFEAFTTKNITYKVLPEFSKTLPLSYEILTDDSLTLSSRYAIKNTPLIPMTIEYELLDSTSFIKTLTYSVTTDVPVVLETKYSVIKTDSAELELTYSTVPPAISIPLTLQYKLAVPKAPVEVTITYVLIPYPYSKYCYPPYSRTQSPYSPATQPFSHMTTPYSGKDTPYKVIPNIDRPCD